jgi:hypothetical protein
MKIDLSDLLLLAGLILAGYGFYLVSLALALIFLGLALIAAGIARAQHERRVR